MAPIERPDWTDDGALVPAGDDYPPPANGLDLGHTAILRDGSELDDALVDPTTARRYRNVVALDDAARTTMDEARSALPRSLVASWDASRAPEGHHLAQAQSAAIVALERLEPSERDELMAGFDGLPETAKVAVLTELGLGSSAHVRPVSQADLDRFFATDAGEILGREWRHAKAERNVGICIARIGRIVGRLSPDGQEKAMAWLDSLSPQTQASIMRALVAR